MPSLPSNITRECPRSASRSRQAAPLRLLCLTTICCLVSCAAEHGTSAFVCCRGARLGRHTRRYQVRHPGQARLSPCRSAERNSTTSTSPRATPVCAEAQQGDRGQSPAATQVGFSRSGARSRVSRVRGKRTHARQPAHACGCCRAVCVWQVVGVPEQRLLPQRHPAAI